MAGFNFFRDVLGTTDPGANDASDPASANFGKSSGPDYAHGAQGGAMGHWNPDGSWTWDSGSAAGITIPANQAQANKDLYDQSVGDPAAAKKAQDDFAKKNNVQGSTDLSGATDHPLAGTVPGGSLDTSQADAQRAQTQGLISLLSQQATTGNGAWQQSFDKAVQGARAGASAVGQDEASQARVGGAGAMRNIANAQGAVDQRAVGEGDILRSQAKTDAQNQLSQLLGNVGQGDISQAAANAAAAQGLRETNQGLAEEGQKQTMSYLQSGAQGAATLAALSKGGRVPGKPKVFGDDERNDTVPALLSPKEIVIPISIAERPDAPAAAARFVAAVKAKHGARKMAVGGTTWQPGQDDPSDFGFNWMGLGTEAPSIGNGGLLDTAQYGQTRGQMDALAPGLATTAAGGNSVADTMAQQQGDSATAQAMAAQNNKRIALANILQANAAQGAKTAGGAGAKRGNEQAAGQRMLGGFDVERRAQELALAKAQQKAEMNNTLMNVGVNLQNAAAIRNAIAAGGSVAATLASAARTRDPYNVGGTQSDGTSTFTNSDGSSTTGTVTDNPAPDESVAGDFPTGSDGAQTAAHGGRIGYARGGDIHPMLTIFIPPPTGNGFAQAAKRYADGGVLSDANVPPSGGVAPSLARVADLRHAQAVSRVAPNIPDVRTDLGSANVPVNGGVGPSLSRISQMRHAQAAERVAAAGEQSPLERLAQTIQSGARMAAGYATVPHLAEGGAVEHYAYGTPEGGVPDAEAPGAVEPDAGVGVAPAPVLYTPGPTPDGGVSAIPQASFQVPGTVGLEPRDQHGAIVPPLDAGPPPAKLPAMRPPAAAAPAAQTSAASAAAHPDALRSPYAKPAPDSFDAEMQAKRQEGELKAQQAVDLAKTQGAYQEQLQRNALQQAELVKRADADAQSLMGHYNDAVDQMKHIDTSVDPGRFWASRSTGQKVLGIIGMAFSALGSRDGTNRAAELLGKAIDRDVDAQKAETEARLKKGESALSASQTAYAMNRQLFQSDLAANAATKASLLDLSINQAEQVKTAYGGKMAGPEADSFIAQLKQARDKYIQQAQSQVVENNLKRSQTAENYAQAAAAGAKGAQLSPERQKAIDDVESATRNIRDNLAKAKSIVREYGTAEVSGPQQGELQRALIDIAQDAARLKDPGSTVREGELAAQKAALGFQGGEWVTPTNATALKLLDSYESGIERRRANAYAARHLAAPAAPATQSHLEE